MFRRSKFANPEFVWIDLKCLTLWCLLLGAVTAIMTNPIWVVKVRMFTTKPEEPTAYRSLSRASHHLHRQNFVLTSWTDGVREIYKSEGLKGLYRGTSLALFGVSNGAIQFMCYEELKRWGFERKRRQFAKAGREWTTNDDKLVSTPHVLHTNCTLIITRPSLILHIQ